MRIHFNARMMRQPIFTEEEARQVIERTAELQKIESPSEFNCTGPVSKYDLAEVLSDAGFFHYNIEQALQEFESKRRNSTTTDTHLIEESEITTFTNQDVIWREIISELKYRLDGNPAVEKIKGYPKEWILTERSGRETTVTLIPFSNGIHFKISRKIGFASAATESLIAGWLLSLIISGYLFVFTNLSKWAVIAVFLAMLSLIPGIFRKFNVDRRNKKRKNFQLLASQVIDHLLKMNDEESESEISSNDSTINQTKD